MATRGLPLFPLGTVLFPGLVLPLTVFEDRYRQLVHHLMALPDGVPREFGVVAISRGWEVAVGAPRSDDEAAVLPDDLGSSAIIPSGDGRGLTLHDVGCTAEVREITEHADGQYELLTVGRRRFHIRNVDADAAAYLCADVDWITDSEGPPGEADHLAPGLLHLFQRYLRLVRPDEAGEQVPDNPVVLSHLIAAATALSLPERQSLLAVPDAAGRMRAEFRLLAREVSLLQQVRAVPVSLTELALTAHTN